jgi:hypothetical protein
MRKLWLGRLLLLGVGTAVPCGILEIWLRSQVAQSGTTPFATSDLPRLPHRLKTSYQTLYKGVQVQMNSLGFRGPEPDPEAGHPTVALVGDSVTFGDGVAEPGTLRVTLEQALATEGLQAEVWNCGIPGFNLENVIYLASQVVMALKPKMLVYVFVSNDVSPSRRRTEIPADAVIDRLEKYPLRSALLQWLGVRLSGLRRSLGFASSKGWVAGVVRQFQQTGEERLREGLKNLKERCATRGIRLLVASYPFLVMPSQNPFAKIESKVEELCTELSIDFVNLTRAFGENEDLTQFWVTLFDSHPDGTANSKAMALLAQHLVPRLQSDAAAQE